MASPGLEELVVTTHRYRAKGLADSVSKNNALLLTLKSKNRTKGVSGGRTLVEPITYNENSTYTRYSGYDTLNISPSDQFTAAEYSWKQAAIAISFSGLEIDVQNTGSEQIFDLVSERMENAENSFANNFSGDLYSDGTLAKQINGIQSLVSDSPSTGTVGGIDRSLYPWWRNYSYSGTTDGGAAPTSSNIEKYMDNIRVNTTRGGDSFDLCIMDNSFFLLYLEALRGRQRINDARGALADAGFQTVKYFGSDVVLDGGYGGQAPSQHAYFLNTKHLKLKVAKKRNLSLLNPDRHSTNQDAVVKIMAWAGNLCMSNAFLQGVLIN